VATVREWGPVANRGLYGAWRHLAFTLRFARAPTARASAPTALLAQAFAFLDGVPVPPATAAPLGPATGLGLDAGLDEVFLGGLPPADAAAAALRGFEGSMDNVRLWWPPCPSPGDPSRCADTRATIFQRMRAAFATCCLSPPLGPPPPNQLGGRYLAHPPALPNSGSLGGTASCRQSAPPPHTYSVSTSPSAIPPPVSHSAFHNTKFPALHHPGRSFLHPPHFSWQTDLLHPHRLSLP
jgi:hypothetical protein